MCEFALGCVNEMWVWCMCDILWVREQSIDVRCNVLVKVLNHQVMIWIFEMFIGCIYYSIDVRYQVIFTKCVHAIWWAVLCVSVCACVNMRCEMCELPFCVVICWSHRIYHCHLMEPSSWIIGASRANFGVLPVIGCVCIISRTVHRFRPMSLWELMMGVFDVLRSPARGWSSYSISVCQHGSFIGCTWCDRFEEVAEFGEVCRQSIAVRYVNLVPMLDHHYISLWHVLCVMLGNLRQVVFGLSFYCTKSVVKWDRGKNPCGETSMPVGGQRLYTACGSVYRSRQK